MIVEQIWTANAYRNFNYVVACPETGDALAIDPLDFSKCLAVAQDRGWRITQIVNTHEHGDHIGGNKAMVAATGAKIIAHRNAGGRISNMDRGVGAGDVIKVGVTVDLECLDTPGHTMSHICLLSRQLPQRRPSKRAVRNRRQATVKAPRRDACLPGTRLPDQQPALYARSRAR
jgi:hydroxyacylglutathione hydrolase